MAALRDSGGVLHVHGNVASGEESAWTRRLEEEIATRAAELGREWSVRVEHVERVKWYAPRIRHLVADVRCVPARLTSAWAHAVGASTSTSPAATPRESQLAIDSSRDAPRPGFVRTRVRSLERPDPSLAPQTTLNLQGNAGQFTVASFSHPLVRYVAPNRIEIPWNVTIYVKHLAGPVQFDCPFVWDLWLFKLTRRRSATQTHMLTHTLRAPPLPTLVSDLRAPVARYRSIDQNRVSSARYDPMCFEV